MAWRSGKWSASRGFVWWPRRGRCRRRNRFRPTLMSGPLPEWAYVLYAGEGGEPLWHQRLVLGRVALSACDYIVVTPDYDLYAERFADTEDVSAV